MLMERLGLAFMEDGSIAVGQGNSHEFIFEPGTKRWVQAAQFMLLMIDHDARLQNTQGERED